MNGSHDIRPRRPKGIPRLATYDDAVAFLRGAFVDGRYTVAQMEYAVPIAFSILRSSGGKERRDAKKRLATIYMLVEAAECFMAPLSAHQRVDMVVALFHGGQAVTPDVVKREFMKYSNAADRDKF